MDATKINLFSLLRTTYLHKRTNGLNKVSVRIQAENLFKMSIK